MTQYNQRAIDQQINYHPKCQFGYKHVTQRKLLCDNILQIYFEYETMFLSYKNYEGKIDLFVLKSRFCWI